MTPLRPLPLLRLRFPFYYSFALSHTKRQTHAVIFGAVTQLEWVEQWNAKSVASQKEMQYNHPTPHHTSRYAKADSNLFREIVSQFTSPQPFRDWNLLDPWQLLHSLERPLPNSNASRSTVGSLSLGNHFVAIVFFSFLMKRNLVTEPSHELNSQLPHHHL